MSDDDLIALGLRVKALEWMPGTAGGTVVFRSSGTFFTSYVCAPSSRSGEWIMRINDHEAFTRHPTLEAAKGAAQADYEARILAALEMTHAALSEHPTVKALVAEARADITALPAVTVYECAGCGRLCRDPEVDLATLRDRGALSCCPERRMEPVAALDPEAIREAAMIDSKRYGCNQ